MEHAAEGVTDRSHRIARKERTAAVQQGQPKPNVADVA